MNNSNQLINKIQNYKYKHVEILNLINKYDDNITYFCLILSFLSLLDYEFKLIGIINNRFKHLCVGAFVVLVLIYRHFMYNTRINHIQMIERYRRIEAYLKDNEKDYDYETMIRLTNISSQFQFDESDRFITKSNQYLIFNKYKKFD